MNFRSINRMMIVRFFILVMIPFVIGCFILPHQHIVENTSLATPSQPEQSAFNSINYSYAQTTNDTSNFEAINAIFPFAEYLSIYPLVRESNPEVCFQDAGSTLTYPDGVTIPLSFYWTVNFNNKENLTVNSSSTVCTPYQFNQDFTYGWTGTIPSAYFDRPDLLSDDVVKFTPNTNAYTSVSIDYGLLQGLVMIPAFYLLIWYPITGIWKKIMHGMLEQ